ncbi:glycosyltransferase family 2 protein [Selenomonas sputigena]|uniref:glycosyltransferase family 2 protein n=1 Tax=Selenomonas sputigena TaxID=69823 RepID=UPI00222F0D14|nr:glycosyltransferase [Selenomonas sputigena]UZD42489.1 glycosyltransferase [Selenomonas sputigena]
MQDELISVVVPVYNNEKYLSRCIESILNQTYPNIEIILVDDGSTDQSGALCDDYGSRYVNVKVIHQENSGQAAARNAAMQHVHGSYIGYVDSDDWVEPDMYEYLFQLIKKYGGDCASIDFKMSDGNVAIQNAKERLIVLRGDEILYHHLLEASQRTGAHSVWRCLFSAKLIANLRFHEGIVNEDIPFKFQALSRVQCMIDSNQVKYFYFQDSLSTTRGAFKKKDLDLLQATEELYRLSLKYNASIQQLAKVKVERSYFSILARIAFYGYVCDESFVRDIILICQKRIRKNLFLLLKAPLPMSRKILCVFFAISFKLTEALIKIAKNRGKIC